MLHPDVVARIRQAARREAHGSGGAAAHPRPETDETLQHPRCVFQVLKRHFSRYTPEMVERIAGVPRDQFRRVCELVTENSGRDATTAIVYSVGWTQHTVGVQYIRTAAILQSLLGNIGRSGGGIMALRGHASIQGSTDIPTLFDLLPGTELTAKSMVLRRLGEVAEPYQRGQAGRLMEAGEVLTAAGLTGAVLAGRSRPATALAGLALLASSALTRFGIFLAGRPSARDPVYTIGPQRQRLAEAGRAAAAGDVPALP